MADETPSGSAKDVADNIREQLKSYQKNLRQQMRRALTVLQAEMIQNIRKNAGLRVGTGNLLGSIQTDVKVESDGSVTGSIGPRGVPYARIHEFGGTIVPKRAKALTIPTDINRRPDGVERVPAKDLKNSFVMDGMIWEKEGEGQDARITPMFILKKSVTIPARPYIRPALAAKQDQILKEFGIFLSLTFAQKKEG